jgi:hypothetical protein
MKKKSGVLFFLVVFINSMICLNTSAQYLYEFINPDLEPYSTNILSSVAAGKGNTGVASSGDVALIYLNPATLNLSNKYQINVGYHLKSEVKDKLMHNIFSFSIAGAYRISKYFQTGFAYQNDYSYGSKNHFIIPEIPSVVVIFASHSFRIPVVFEYKFLRVGANLNFAYYYISYKDNTTGSFWKVLPEIGTVITPIKEFSIGASYIPDFKSDFKIITVDNTTLNNNPYAIYPDRIKLGTEIRTSNNDIKFTFDYHLDLTSENNTKKGHNNYNVGFEFEVEKNWLFRFGLFTSQDYFNEYEPNLTLGSAFKLNKYSFNLALLKNFGDSGYNMLNFGAGYEF